MAPVSRGSILRTTLPEGKLLPRPAESRRPSRRWAIGHPPPQGGAEGGRLCRLCAMFRFFRTYVL